VLLAIGSCVAFVTWINRPGDVLEPERLLSKETTGYVEWTLRLEDPGTGEFFELMLENLQSMQDGAPSILPRAIDGPLRRMQSRSNEKKLRRIFPVVLVWTVEPRTKNQDDHLLSASLRGLDHQLLLADWLLGLIIGHDEDTSIVHHRKEKIYLFDLPAEKDSLPTFIHRGDLFFTTNEDSARRAIDRLQSPTIAEIGPSLGPWLDRAPEGSLRGALSNQKGEVWRAWSDFLDEEIQDKVSADLRQALDGLTVGGAFTSEGSLEARITFYFRDAENAVVARDPIQGAIADLLDDTPVTIGDIEVAGSSLSFNLEIADIPVRLPRPVRPSD
jgi:hypothetical protein